MNTEVQQLGPRLVLGWLTIQRLNVNAVYENTVKFKGPDPIYATGAPQKSNKKGNLSYLCAALAAE